VPINAACAAPSGIDSASINPTSGDAINLEYLRKNNIDVSPRSSVPAVAWSALWRPFPFGSKVGLCPCYGLVNYNIELELEQPTARSGEPNNGVLIP
jgi:hypothetical protein